MVVRNIPKPIVRDEIPKLRTKLAKNAEQIKNNINLKFPGIISNLFVSDETGLTDDVVPLSLIVGIDGTTREVEDSSGESQQTILAAAAAIGIVNKNNILLSNDVPVEPVIIPTDGRKDLLIMKCLEYRTYNHICDEIEINDLVALDGALWNILEDSRLLIDNPELHHFFPVDEYEHFVNNLTTQNTCHIVKEFYSYDIESQIRNFDQSLENLNHKRVADALLNPGESFNETIHQKNMLNKYPYISSSRQHEGRGYFQSYNKLRKVAEDQYSGAIVKFKTNQSSVKIEFLNNNIFQKNKDNVLKTLEIDMKGIQKEPFATFFAERSSKYVARATHSNYLMEQKNGMNSEDYIPNIPYKVRT